MFYQLDNYNIKQSDKKTLVKYITIHGERFMTEDKKIKIGKLCNKIATVLFVLFFIDTCVMPIMNKRFFITSVVIIAILFAICSITSHILLKDYKPE